jgi:hypothetical protein
MWWNFEIGVDSMEACHDSGGGSEKTNRDLPRHDAPGPVANQLPELADNAESQALLHEAATLLEGTMPRADR